MNLAQQIAQGMAAAGIEHTPDQIEAAIWVAANSMWDRLKDLDPDAKLPLEISRELAKRMDHILTEGVLV